MKSSKESNHSRPVAFFLIAVILIFTIGFAAGGWQSISNNSDDSGKVENNNDNADNDNMPQVNPGPEIYIPEFVELLTGLETDEATASSTPKAFLMNSSQPLYGISASSVIIEFPTESSTTRLLAYISSASLPTKIGSLTPTRKYIDNIAACFGGIIISKGNDDSIVYDGTDVSDFKLDLLRAHGYYYTEYTDYTYTNPDLINAAIENIGIKGKNGTADSIPFNFVDFGMGEIFGEKSAYNIVLPFSDGNETVLTYLSQNTSYVFSKNGEIKRDALNDKKLEFKNVFILFADATTYETASASEMILHTNTSGKGMYFTNGTQKNFYWRMDASSGLIFTDEVGEPLSVNRGTSYIGFMKSSKLNTVSVN